MPIGHKTRLSSSEGNFFERTFYRPSVLSLSLQTLPLSKTFVLPFKMHYAVKKTFVSLELHSKEELKHYNRIIQTKCHNNRKRTSLGVAEASENLLMMNYD